MTAWIVSLAERVGCDPALVGDLLEERARHRSGWWLFREIALAIVLQAVGDVRQHPILVGRAIVLGWLTMLASFALLAQLRNLEIFDEAYHWLIVQYGSRELPFSGLLMYQFWAIWWMTRVASGWVIARTHPAARSGALIAFTLTVLWVGAPAPRRIFPEIVFWLDLVLATPLVLTGGYLGSSRISGRSPQGTSRS